MRKLSRESGYSLVELLIVAAIVAMVAGAIAAVYQVSLQVFTRSSSLEEAQLGARAGLDRMVTELRLAGSYWIEPTGAILVASPTTFSFVGDVDADTVNNNGEEITLEQDASAADTQIIVDRTTGTGSGNAFEAGEYVYVASGARRVVRQIAAGYTIGTTLPLTSPLAVPVTAPGAVVRSVEIVTYALNAGSLTRNGLGIVDNVTALTLTYYDGANPPSQTADLALIREIQISLTTQGSDGSRRTMTSSVRLRNLQ